MENYIDKVAIVTGSSSGIGVAISKELVKRGCVVIGLARRMDKLQSVADEINKMNKVSKGKFYPMQCDISDKEQIQKIMSSICNNYGIPWIVVNNAGIAKLEPFFEFDGDVFDSSVNTNAKGLVLITKIAVNLMIENSIDGHIININSLAGYVRSMPHYMSSYGGSKSIALFFSQGIRDLIAKNQWNIKVSDISPGLTQSEMTEGYYRLINEWDNLLTSDNIANACITVLDTPPNVLISEMLIRPMNSPKERLLDLFD